MQRNLICGAFIAVILSAGGGLQARTWLVEKDGSGDYTTIQPAVDGAAPGDTIRLGVGRWTEYAPIDSQGQKWIEDVYVHVTVDSLTIMGSGADESIIGPATVVHPPQEWPKGICVLEGITRLTVADLTVEHIREGMHVLAGALLVRGCVLRGGHAGVLSWAESGNVISSSRFLDNSDAGVIGLAGAGGFVITQCQFANNPYGIDFYTVSALVEHCTFSGGGVGAQFTQGAIGTLRNCTFLESISNYSLVIRMDAGVVLQDCRLLGGAYKVVMDSGAELTGTGNVFAGSRIATLQLIACSPDLHGNDFLRGAGPTVLVESYLAPLHTIDMTGNYWGTDNPDSIAAWIHDGHDDPSVYAYVQYEPFSLVRLPTEQKTLGGIKGMFR